jgi:HD-GYP domain-containing protein (c-di-GMP phosphodiesterase class II)
LFEEWLRYLFKVSGVFFGNVIGGEKVVRISDLIREGIKAPAEDEGVDEVRIKKLAELARFGLEANPLVDVVRWPSAEGRPENAPEQQPQSTTAFLAPSEGSADQSSAAQAPSTADYNSTPPGKQNYLDAQDYLREVQGLVRSGKQIDPERPLRLVERVIAEPSRIEEMYALTLVFGHGNDLLIAHAVNNMIYALKIALRLGYSSSRLTGIALAALLHDIGLFLIPESVLQKKEKLTDAELAEIKNHSRMGRDLLQGFDSIDPHISRAVYEHHEREGGQGYHAGIANGEICEYAQIIGICDSYEAMTHDRPYKKSMEQYVAVLKLAESKDHYFNLKIVKVFLDEITLYPIGSHVRLNNGAIGEVVSTNPANPFKPKVRIVVDGQGHRISNENLCDLSVTNILNIVTGVSADEVSA